MSDTRDDLPGESLSFLQRWSQRKQQRQISPETKSTMHEISVAEGDKPEQVTEQTLPPLESLDENSEVGMFFDEQVSEQLKRKVLRKLFHMDKFNVCDGLDDYAEDYTCFEPLGEIITAHQRLREEREKLARMTATETEAGENIGPEPSRLSETPYVDSSDDQTEVNTQADDGEQQKEG